MTHPPDGLKERGQRLWRDTLAAGTPSAAGLVLLEEACRIADRLDALDVMLTQASDVDPTIASSVLAEARLQAATLKGLVAELRQSADRGKAAPGGTVQTGAKVRDDLAARRRARLSDASGS